MRSAAPQLTPTHVARTEALLAEAIAFAPGGLIDITSGGGSAASACEPVRLAFEAGVAPGNITISSDGNGLMPVFDTAGKIAAVAAAAADRNRCLLPQLVDAGVAPPNALALTARARRAASASPRATCRWAEPPTWWCSTTRWKSTP